MRLIVWSLVCEDIFESPKWQEQFANGPNVLQAQGAEQIDPNDETHAWAKFFNHVVYVQIGQEFRFAVLYHVGPTRMRFLYPNYAGHNSEYASAGIKKDCNDIFLVARTHVQNVIASS